MDINRVTLVGRLTRDPEAVVTQTGTPLAKFSIAVNGYKEGESSFVDVVCFKQTAKFVVDYLTKGRRVAIDGSLSQSRWQDKQSGQNRSKIEVVASQVQSLDPPNQERPPQKQEQKPQQQAADPWGKEEQRVPRAPDDMWGDGGAPF